MALVCIDNTCVYMVESQGGQEFVSMYLAGRRSAGT